MVRKSKENGSDSVAPFLTKCYEMVDDEATDSIISWTQPESCNSFIIWDMTEFSVRLLPLYFKHNNFSSFMRQLNIYGFRKIDTDRWEFASDGFVRGQKHLLKNICRRKKLQQQDNSDGPAENIENMGLWKEVESLKTDKNLVMQELIKLRQHQETSDNKLLLLRDRLQGMETNQQQMLSFLVMAMQSPGILVQLLQPKEKNWRMLEESKEDDRPVASDGTLVRYQPPVSETPKPLHTVTPSSEKQQESDPSPDGKKDFFLSPDFLKMLTDEKLCSLDTHAPFMLPDSPDDGAWEQLLLDSPFLENDEDRKMDDEELIDSEMEMESTESKSQLEMSQNFERLMEQMEKCQYLGMESSIDKAHLGKSQNLEFLTEQMGLLSSETNNKHASQ
ncbi:heat stress transcription factor A-8 [Quercus robur]|uniref:heat stress transcription factor A-8 n=1 Tax=Quercus robur TaxID=38942 RepID=UPI0021633C93|nr:heat stress transcription factor A-8 [Quercus robur]